MKLIQLFFESRHVSTYSSNDFCIKMYPKGKKEDAYRHSRPRKKVFKRNQFSDKSNDKLGESATAKKLHTASSTDFIVDPTHYYRIIEFLTVFSAISNIVICKDCKQDMKFEETGIRGLGFKVIVLCRCGRREINSGPFINNGYEINRRIVYVMRLLGIAREGINKFCGLMDIGQGISYSAYNNIVQHIHSASKNVFEALCAKAVTEEQKENEKHERPLSNLKISGDGSWKKRGFTSLYGVTTLIGYYSVKIVDLLVKGSYCQSCNYWRIRKNEKEFEEWYEEHAEECAANHSGSVEKMEVDAIKEMFLRSEKKYNVKYSNYIGDGDSKTYKAILDLNPYGNDLQVIKNECIGHVEKRMGTRLRNLKKNQKLGGKGKLTNTLIMKLTKYYGLVIRRNIDSVDNMEKSIMATYYHFCSTNKNPRHENCPGGTDSWCKWRVAEGAGKEEECDHPPPFHSDLQQHLLPIYQDLSKRDLLERYLGGHTQNPNENFNATIWLLAPKHLHAGIKIIEIAVYSCLYL